MNIIIYTEGGFYLGLGNIYRMMELARSLKQKDKTLQIEFITSSEDYVVNLIKNKGWNVKKQPVGEIPQTISELNFKVLIIDKLNIEESFIQKIKNLKKESFKVVLFGNTSSANHISDLVINSIVGTDYSNKIYTDKYGTTYLEGPKYMALRSEFLHHSYIYKKACKNILLLFGGTDQANYSCKVLKKLLQYPVKFNITLVIGKGYKFSDKLKLLLKDKPNNVNILENISNVNEVMLKNDFLITSAGTALFEGLYQGLPCVAFYQNESQKEVFGSFSMATDYSEIKNIGDYILDIYNNYESYLEKVKKLEVGEGKNEILDCILDK